MQERCIYDFLLNVVRFDTIDDVLCNTFLDQFEHYAGPASHSCQNFIQTGYLLAGTCVKSTNLFES